MRLTDAASTEAQRERTVGLHRSVSPGALVLAVTLPIVFLHLDYQPAVSVGRATVKLSDLMILLTAVAAAATLREDGLRRLRAGLPIWIAALLFLGWILAATFYPLLSPRAYAWKTHLVTAGEFGEYALLAPAVPLLLRRRADALLVLLTLVGWTIVATAVGVLQWAGWNILHGWGRGYRQPSFLGTHEFAALAGMTLGLGMVALLWGVGGRLRAGAYVAIVTGVVGFVLGGATAGVVGLVPAAILTAAIAVRRRRAERGALAITTAAVLLASLGVVGLRSGDFGQFFRFVGAGHATATRSKNIETYPQRTMLAYIGARIWLHHPIIGVGWQGSNEVSVFGRELPAAHARFPHIAQISFPSARHPYGVQDLYVQTLADLGTVGFVLLAALFGAGLWRALRVALRAPPGIAFAALLGAAWLALALGFWSAEGLVAGIPLDAVTWLGFGAAAHGIYSPS